MVRFQTNQAAASSDASTDQNPSVTSAGAIKNQESLETEATSTEWTNEKHSLYLKSIEASFVNQLYDSLDLLNCNSQNEQPPSSSRILHKPSSSPSTQFKVLQDGLWRKINYKRHGIRQNNVRESRNAMNGPWTKYISPVTSSLKQKGVISCGSAAKMELPSRCCSYLNGRGVNINAALEVSDQNFVDEDVEGEQTGTNSMPSAKRMKTRKGGTSNSDQVVPFGRPILNDEVADTCASSGG